MTGRSVDAVVFDYGGVLTTPVRDTVAAWLDADGIDPASYRRVLRRWMSPDAADGTPIHRLETGELTGPAFEALIAAELTAYDGRTVAADGLLGRLFAALRPDEAVYAMAEELRELGVTVALLSNSWGNTYPRERIDALFDPVVISGEVGLRKPLAPIYRHALDRLGVPGERVVFLDDSRPNVEGAEAVGMRALQHVDAAGTRTALAELVPELSRPTRAGSSP